MTSGFPCHVPASACRWTVAFPGVGYCTLVGANFFEFSIAVLFFNILADIAY